MKWVLIIVGIIVIGMILFVSYSFNNYLESRELSNCEYTKLKIAARTFEKIDAYNNYFYLCSNEECEKHYTNQINNSLETIEGILNINCEQLLNKEGVRR